MLRVFVGGLKISRDILFAETASL